MALTRNSIWELLRFGTKLMPLGVSNRRRFRFQASQLRLSILVQFKIQLQIRVEDRDFDINSIYFD